MTDDGLTVTRREFNKALAGSPLVLGLDDSDSILDRFFGSDGITIVNSDGETLATDVNTLEYGLDFDVQIDDTGEPKAILSLAGSDGASPWEVVDGEIVPSGSATDARANSFTGDEVRVREGRGFIGLPAHHVNYSSGLSNEEISRYTLSDGDVLEVWRLEVAMKGGGTNSNVTVDVYDETNESVLASVTGGNRSEGGTSPLGSSGSGATITVRITTGSNAVDLTTTGFTSITSD